MTKNTTWPSRIRRLISGNYLCNPKTSTGQCSAILGDTTSITIKCLHDKKDLKFVDALT